MPEEKEDSEDIIVMYPGGSIRIFEHTGQELSNLPKVCTIHFLKQRMKCTY